jgi:hypothetical protein
LNVCPIHAHDFHPVAVMHFGDRFAYLRERVPEDDVAVANVPDRDGFRRAWMKFPIE